MLSSSAIAQLIFLSVLLLTDGHAAVTSIRGGDQCNNHGYEQSPIDINRHACHTINEAQPIVFVNYNTTLLSLQFDDHSVKLTPTIQIPEVARAVGIAAGGLRSFFILDNIHFHWGSEHTIDGKRYLMEAHFVHYNEIYANVQEALSDPGGIAVIGVLFSEGPTNNDLDEIITGAARTGASGVPAQLDLTPRQLLPADTSRFFRYHGSLTTPPCTESVIWSVLHSMLTTTPIQMNWFQIAPLTHGPLSSNYRSIQDIGSREVELWIVSYTNNVSLHFTQ